MKRKNRDIDKNLNINKNQKYHNSLTPRTSKTPIKIKLDKNAERISTKTINNENINEKIKINSFYTTNRSTLNLNSICTFDKVIMVQKLLRELSSKKEKFKENINQYTEKINNKCYTYFKDKIYIKEILDYCSSNQLEEHISYNLSENIQQIIDKNLYQMIYDFYFLIRNENYILIELIKLSDDETNNKNLSDFIVHFLYENLINCSFIQDELLLNFKAFINNKIIMYF